MSISTTSEFVSELRQFAQETVNRISWGENPKVELTQIVNDETKLWMVFSDGEVDQHLTIPVPVPSNAGYYTISGPTCERVVGSWMIAVTSSLGKKSFVEVNYWQLMMWLLTERVEKYFPSSSKRIHFERLLRSFGWNASALVFKNLQSIIDSIANSLPLKGTEMQAWAMSNRIQILDPDFDSFTPQQALNYQGNLNKDLFPFTSLGLSDSNMTQNVILKQDIRKTIPFGLRHHNPRRNLYQTLGMKGDETPNLKSHTEANLEAAGVVRKGWNLVTAFVDMPDNFEDQIIVSDRHRDKFVTEYKKYTCHGLLLIEENSPLSYLDPISIEPDGNPVSFDVYADSAVVESINNTRINFDGKSKDVSVVTIKLKKILKDGFKITNRAGNKGIIFTTDTGYMDDPVRGKIPIDVIVSAKSVGKRKNYGQLLEALTTLLVGPDTGLVIDDDKVCHIDNISKALQEKGYREDGTVDIHTQWGKFSAVCGWCFWGVIKTPEDQLWTRRDTTVTNGKGLRQAGNKLSHIEFKALTTIFGTQNPVTREILSHRQGTGHTFEILQVLKGMTGELPENLITLNWNEINQVDQSSGFFHEPADISGTIADDTFHPNGFLLRLPSELAYIISEEEGNYSEDVVLRENIPDGFTGFVLDRILIPGADLRKCWKHSAGKLGLTDVASLGNNIVKSLYRWEEGEEELSQVGIAIHSYLHGLSRMLSTKKGLLSSYTMSVRYPNTTKATAVVRSDLRPNEIRIHEDMARQLGVGDGNFVLVERFPCLGFMSLRVQKVVTTDDPQAKFVIGVSGNSLASLTLDFDGDVIYLMSFHTPEAKEALKTEFESPHSSRFLAYDKACSKKVPEFKEMTLPDYNMEIFTDLTPAKNAEIVEGLTGIKRGTGTVIALCYNLMRIIEKNIGFQDTDMSVALELLLDKIANSVFSKKHAGRSLEEECREAVCTANITKMINLGFDQGASEVLCSIIRNLSKTVGINPKNLEDYYSWADENNRSSIVNRIVRKHHKVWLTSRSNLHPIDILENLNEYPQDLVGWMFRLSLKEWKSSTTQETEKLELAA